MPAGSKASKKIALSRADAETLILSQVLRDYDLLATYIFLWFVDTIHHETKGKN